MRTSSLRASALVTGAAALALGMTACGDEGSSSESTVSDTAAATASPFDGELVGTFSLDGTVCTDGVFIGSYLRLVEPGGTPENGPFLTNEDSPCDDQTYSLLVPGTDTGFVPGRSGQHPIPPRRGRQRTRIGHLPARGDLRSRIRRGHRSSGVGPVDDGANGILTGDLSASPRTTPG